ncbi:hypothetical protein AX16_001713 [Volvariella volvacea WC 439]|nr:hypothetical protein AX16_001713 [Volvariella volvacea WC 439]
MRFSNATLILLGSLSLSINLGIALANPHGPVPAHAEVERPLHQITRAEIQARENHPEYFYKRDDGTAPSNGPENPCGGFSAPQRKRDFVQVLDARETAAFLLGRGQFTSSNGTSYEDYDYKRKMRRAASEVKRFHPVFNVVRDTLGKRLLQVSIPHYKRWKRSLDPEQLVHLSDHTTIRAKDVDQLEAELLADSEFTEIEVHGFHLTREFFEIVRSF